MYEAVRLSNKLAHKECETLRKALLHNWNKKSIEEKIIVLESELERVNSRKAYLEEEINTLKGI